MPFTHIQERANQTHLWCPSDTESAYVPVQKTGSHNYTKTDIAYKFNSHGYRCDEFTEQSDLSILFLGCSFTEGIGLPLHHCWPTLLLNKIKALPKYANMQIPFWNLALGGTGIDTMARAVSAHIDQIKPSHIIYFTHSFYRREFMFDSNSYHWWLPCTEDTVNKRPPWDILFVDEFYAEYQSTRSLQIIDLAARIHNSKVHVFECAGDNVSKKLARGKFSNTEFQNLGYLFENNKVEIQQYATEKEQAMLSTKPSLARDNSHPGIVWQFLLAAKIWNHIKHEFEG